MPRNLFVFIGGSDAQNGDYSFIYRLARSGRTAKWSTLKTARPGDRVLLYVQKPISALVATAVVMGYPVKGSPGDYAYRAKLGRFELTPNRVTYEDLKRIFPSWPWLRFPRRGAVVPDRIADRLWSLVHEKQSRVQILISNAAYGLRELYRMAETGTSGWWSCPKLTARGDKLLFYVEAPESAVLAVGTVLSGTRRTDSKWYEARVGNIEMLENPLSLAELRGMFPGWAWLRSVNMFAYVSPERARALLRRVNGARRASEDGLRGGAGFGDPESNRLTERAAVRHVKSVFRDRGYLVSSREREQIGYDLDARKGRTKLHLEVKGVSGGLMQFPITRQELGRARRDPAFWLVAVTNARKPTRSMHEFAGTAVARLFRLQALSYMATRRG